MTCVPRAVTCASAQSDPSSLSARRNLGHLATHRVRSQTDETVNIHVNLTLPWVAKSFCWVCHALAHMFKPSEINRPITCTYEFIGAVAKLVRTSALRSGGCVLDPLSSHTKEFKHDITAAALSLAISIEQTEMVGLV